MRTNEAKREFFDRVYDILVQKGGAYEGMREGFLYYHLDESIGYYEWRFGGKLGFGGKYRAEKNAIDCYREDENKKTLKLIDEINKDLVELKRKYGI